ncbi:unnamed protein product, partial [Allacma fusca]
MVVGSKPKTGM